MTNSILYISTPLDANCHQTCQSGDIPRGASTKKFEWSLNEVVFWSNLANWIHSISTYRRPMDTKLGKLLTYREMFQLLKSQNPLISRPTWVHVTIWKVFIATFTRHSINVAGCWLRVRDLARKRFRRHQLLFLNCKLLNKYSMRVTLFPIIFMA